MNLRRTALLILLPFLATACGDKTPTAPPTDPLPETPEVTDVTPDASTPKDEGDDPSTASGGSDPETPGATPDAPQPDTTDGDVEKDPQSVKDPVADGTAPDTKPDANAPAAGERKATTEADAALAKFGKLMRLPTTGVKTFKAKLRSSNRLYGDGIGANPEWTPEKGLVLNVEISKEFRTKNQIPDQALPTMIQMVENNFKPYIAVLFETVDRTKSQYHVKHKPTEQGLRVDMMPMAEEGIAWERLKLYFDKDGLVERMIGIRHFADMDAPEAAQLAGTEEEYAFEYAKYGDGHVLKKIEVMTAAVQGTLDLEYFDLKTAAALPDKITITSPTLPDPILVWMHDYELDGKLIEKTKYVKPAQEEPEAPKTPDGAKTPEAPKTPDTPK